MAKWRKFTKEFKRQVVEEMLAGITTQAELIRRYDLSYNLLSNWRKAYEKGKLGEDGATEVKAKDVRIRDLERKVGELTMEIDLLKKAAKYRALERKEQFSIVSGPTCERSGKGAK